MSPPILRRSALVLLTLVACGARGSLTAGSADGAASAVDGTAEVGLEPPQNADVHAVWPGAGCGQPLPDGQIQTVPGSPKGYTHFTVMGTGANLTGTPIAVKAGPRTFWVRVPADYNPNRPYRVVFIGQGCGGYKTANTSTYQLFKESSGGTEQAIYVALDIPEDMANQDCYDNRDGLKSQEWEAFELFMTFVDQHYCVDLNKIDIAGYSTGSWLANMWGCYFSGWPEPPRKFAPRYHVRAQASYSGGEPAEQPTCGGPVAAFWLHDVNDAGNSIEGNRAALARVGRMNHCDTNLENPALWAPWHADDRRIGDVCRKNVACPGDTPVVWCQTMGLGKSSQDDRMIPAVTHFFDEVEAGRSVPGPVCHPECELGQSTCDALGLQQYCQLDASGCPHWATNNGFNCNAGFVCCPTCGGPQGAACVRKAGCPAAPDVCGYAGTFCLDDGQTIVTCKLEPETANTPECVVQTATTTCPGGQRCTGYATAKCE